MKRFNITVNGKAYDVAVEEITDGSAPVVSVPVATAPKSTPAPASAPTPAPAGAGEKVTAPMPGTILDVKVSVGDTVTKGQAIMVLEAMKMENDIVAPCDGKVTSVTVKKGDSVNSADTLATVQ
ncbi:MAG: biotin/lipoyl-containing protein [Oscillospiraceae bacterium]